MINEILRILSENADEKQATKMAAYMQNLFPFAGIPKPKLKVLIRPFIRQTAKEPLDWELLFKLWNADYREAQYTALEFLSAHRKKLTSADMAPLKILITAKSWWDTVDMLDAFIGEIVKKDTSLKAEMLAWATDENLWLRRVAIDFQQGYKADTDQALLAEIVSLNFGSREFFINKAIGWSLREYGKTNPEWVKRFIAENSGKMAPLSVREATKRL